ncbi:MAG: hypothetical protein KGZ39_04460 [Simkania sp.]|nr:hypothetical protein [Simkania sp.]
MSGATSPHYPEKKTWVNPSSSSQWMTRHLTNHGPHKTKLSPEDELFSVDDTPEFHDPYSELSLFLSQKIKHEMKEHGWVKKWSLKIQEALLEKMAPEFQKKFPHYRLGVVALRKTWEKIAYYTQQIETEKEAVGQDGQLNIAYLIRENLRQYPQLATISGFHPYQYAHQLALKISECIAVVDGVKPAMDHLSRTVWSMQRHLLSWATLQEAKSPYDEYDRLDKLIVKTILEITSSEPHISAVHLEAQVKESILALCEMPALSSHDLLHANVSAIIAEKLYPFSPLHFRLLPEEKVALLDFIEHHLKSSQLSSLAPLPSELIRRIVSLYLLASQLPKGLEKQALYQAVDATFHQIPIAKPSFGQALFAFISAEMIILTGQGINDLATIQESVFSSYSQACKLPVTPVDELEILEITIWKQLSEKQHLLEKLPYRIGLRIETEVAMQLIDNPKQNFGSLVHHTLHAFQKNKELTLSKKPIEIEKKIKLWCQQGDLLCRCVRFDSELPLLKKIQALHTELKNAGKQLCCSEFVGKVCQAYLYEHPTLGCYATQLSQRVYILYKYSWYTFFSDAQESSIDRFLLWQKTEIERLLPKEYLREKIRSLFVQTLPLIPLDIKILDRLLAI